MVPLNVRKEGFAIESQEECNFDGSAKRQIPKNIAFERSERRQPPTPKPQEEPGNLTQRGSDDG